MACVFITKEVISSPRGHLYGGAYKDVIGICPHTNEVYCIIRGQNQGRRDKVMIDAYFEKTQIHIFSRKCCTDKFIYRGIGFIEYYNPRSVPINQSAMVEQMSSFEIKIASCDVKNVEINPINYDNLPYQKYKAACVAYLATILDRNLDMKKPYQDCFFNL